MFIKYLFLGNFDVVEVFVLGKISMNLSSAQTTEGAATLVQSGVLFYVPQAERTSQVHAPETCLKSRHLADERSSSRTWVVLVLY